MGEIDRMLVIFEDCIDVESPWVAVADGDMRRVRSLLRDIVEQRKAQSAAIGDVS